MNIHDIYTPNQVSKVLGNLSRITLPFWTVCSRNNTCTEKDVENAYKVIEYYFGSVENINDEHIQSFINMCTDTFFLYGHNRTIEYFLQQNMQVFQYLLTYEGSYSLTNIYGFEPLGVSHADDLIYLFDPIFHGLLPELPDKGD